MGNLLQHKSTNKITVSMGRIFGNRYTMVVIICIITLLFNLHPALVAVSTGLDPSFVYGFNKAISMHLSFGDQFISTYGPLGYLTHDLLPQYMVQASVAQVLYSIALGVGIYLFIKRLCKLKSKLWGYAIAIVMAYAFSVGSSSSIDFNYLSLFLLYCFLLVSSELPYYKRKLLLAALALVAAIFLYVKFTLGFASLGALLCLPLSTLKLRPAHQRIKSIIRTLKETIFVGFLYFLFAFVLTIPLYINNFLDYIKSGWIMSYGFSGAMSFQQQGTFNATIICALAIIVLLLMFIIPLPKAKTLAHNMLFLIIPAFVAWKYAVVRQDAHIIFLAQFTFPIGILVLFARLKKNWIDISALLAMIAIVVTFTVIATPLNKLSTNQTIVGLIGSPINNLKQLNTVKFLQISAERNTWKQESQVLLAGDVLPNNFRKIIGGAGVDIYPWEASIVAANNLNWKPRPSPFSFESYSPYFDNLNTSYFKSKRAPEYIVWQNILGNVNSYTSSIDGRNVLWDEPRTVDTILQKYSAVASSNSQLILLKKIFKPPTRPLKVLGRQTAIWNHWIKIPNAPKGDFVFLSASYKTSMLIKLEDFLLRSPTINIAVAYKEGVVSFRIVPANLSQGFLINPLPYDWQQFSNLFSHGKSNGTALSIEFIANSNYVSRVSNISIKWLSR